MANLTDSPSFKVYYTPFSAWKNIQQQIDFMIEKPDGTTKIVWEACMLKSYESRSPEILNAIGVDKVVFDYEMDCLTDEPDEWDMIITNIPFDKKIKIPVLKRFVGLDKPFILIMNSMNTFTKYLREVFKGQFKYLQIITPDNKINFDRLEEDGTITKTKNCSFYCIYLCYKCNFNQEDLWLGATT